MVLIGHEAAVEAVAWSLDGRYIAFGDSNGTFNIWLAETGEQINSIDDFDIIFSLEWSPDGQQLAIADSLNVLVWDFATKEIDVTLEGHTGTIRSVHWSPDGRRLASAGDNDTVHIWNVASDGEFVLLEAHTRSDIKDIT